MLNNERNIWTSVRVLHNGQWMNSVRQRMNDHFEQCQPEFYGLLGRHGH